MLDVKYYFSTHEDKKKIFNVIHRWHNYNSMNWHSMKCIFLQYSVMKFRVSWKVHNYLQTSINVLIIDLSKDVTSVSVYN